MLTYSLKETGEALYLQLYKLIRSDIQNGILKPDEKLPSKRKLAEHLHISLITVENAYAQLIIEGYIYTIEKKGYFVASLTAIVPRTPLPSIPLQNQSEHYTYDLSANSVQTDSFPFDTWARLTRRILSERSSELLERSQPMGYYPLRQAIASHLYTTLGMEVSAEQIVIGSGTEYMYGQLVQMLGRELTYGYEVPGHKSISRVYHSFGVKAVPLEMDSRGVRMDRIIKQKINVVHISAAHHFPTGITMPISRRYELLSWAENTNGIIIEDDYDSEFRMQGKPIPPLFSLDHGGHVIYMNTFSKTLSPSFRISYMALPEALLERYRQTIGFYSCTVSSFEQIILERFIAEGYFERHINRTRHACRTVRNLLLEGIEPMQNVHPLEILEENAGLHFLLRHNYNISDHALKELGKSLSLNVAMLSDYYPEPFDSHTLIINYSGLSEEQVGALLEVLEQLFTLCRTV